MKPFSIVMYGQRAWAVLTTRPNANIIVITEFGPAIEADTITVKSSWIFPTPFTVNSLDDLGITTNDQLKSTYPEYYL